MDTMILRGVPEGIDKMKALFRLLSLKTNIVAVPIQAKSPSHQRKIIPIADQRLFTPAAAAKSRRVPVRQLRKGETECPSASPQVIAFVSGEVLRAARSGVAERTPKV